jgi:hypothetical protein
MRGSLDAYHDTFVIALLFFAVHILSLAALLYRSRYVPRPLSIWLVLGTLGYFAYSLGNIALGVEVPLIAVAPGALAEVTLLLLMLLGRVNHERRH